MSIISRSLGGPNQAEILIQAYDMCRRDHETKLGENLKIGSWIAIGSLKHEHWNITEIPRT